MKWIYEGQRGSTDHVSWSSHEDDVLRNNQKLTAYEIQKNLLPHRSYQAIKIRRSTIRVQYDGVGCGGTHWTNQDTQLLIEKYSTLTTRELAELLNKSRKAVERKFTQLRATGVRLVKSPQFLQKFPSVIMPECLPSTMELEKSHAEEVELLRRVIYIEMKLGIKKDDWKFSDVAKL